MRKQRNSVSDDFSLSDWAKLGLVGVVIATAWAYGKITGENGLSTNSNELKTGSDLSQSVFDAQTQAAISNEASLIADAKAVLASQGYNAPWSPVFPASHHARKDIESMNPLATPASSPRHNNAPATAASPVASNSGGPVGPGGAFLPNTSTVTRQIQPSAGRVSFARRR